LRAILRYPTGARIGTAHLPCGQLRRRRAAISRIGKKARGDIAMKLLSSHEKEKFYIQLLRDNSAILLTYAHSRVADNFQAEDIVQDVWVTAWKKIDDVFESSNPTGWLINALKNHLHRYYEHLANNRELSDKLTFEADQAAAMPEFNHAISFASVLSPGELRIVKLKEQGYKHREIAEMLGSSKGTIDSRLSRIKEKLARFLESE
jgi:RNA polymerase sigma-70 factor (ECF subfamily)